MYGLNSYLLLSAESRQGKVFIGIANITFELVAIVSADSLLLARLTKETKKLKTTIAHTARLSAVHFLDRSLNLVFPIRPSH